MSVTKKNNFFWSCHWRGEEIGASLREAEKTLFQGLWNEYHAHPPPHSLLHVKVGWELLKNICAWTPPHRQVRIWA